MGFRLRSIMQQGTDSSIPESWTQYQSIEDARSAARGQYHNDRVLRAVLVVDCAGWVVEWAER